MKININKKPYILNNKDFRTIQIQVMFPIKFKKEDLAYIYLLPNMLKFMNNKYPSEDKFLLAKKKLYVLNTYCDYIRSGLNGFFIFSMIIPDTKSLKENLLEKQFSLFGEMIYNPLVNNNGFDLFELEKEKMNTIFDINNYLKNIDIYQNIRLREIIDKDNIFSLSLARSTDLIEKVTTSDLYNYYKKIIVDNSPIIFVMGNVDENKINNLCDKYLYKNFNNKVIDMNSYYFMDIRDEVLEITEDSSFNNSCLSIVYKLKDANGDDYIYLNYVRDILTSISSGLLSKTLRDDLAIVYSVNVVPYFRYGLLEIRAFLKDNNMEIAKDKIIETINSLKNCDVFKDKIKNLVDRKRLAVIKKKDDKYLIFDDFIFNSLGLEDTLEEYYEKYKNISCEDISNFISRLVLDTIYFLKEKNHE